MENQSPRISLTLGRASDGPRIVGDLNPHSMSMTFYLMWLFLVTLNPSLSTHSDVLGNVAFQTPGTSEALSAQESYNFFIILLLLVSAVVLLLIGAFGAKKPQVLKFFDSTCIPLSICAECLCCLATVCAYLIFNIGILMVILGGIFAGIGVALNVVLWGSVLKKLKFPSLVLNTSLSFCIAYAVSAFLVSWVPSLLIAILACALPFCCLLVFKKPISKPDSFADENENPYASTNNITESDRHTLNVYIFRCWLALALFGIVLGALRVICCNSLLDSNSFSIELVLCGGAITSIVVILTALATSRKETSWDHFFRAIFPITIFSIALIGFCCETSYVAVFFIAISFVCLEVLVWVFLSSVAKDLDLPAAKMFGIGYGFLQLGACVGLLLFNYVMQNSSSITLIDLITMQNVSVFSETTGINATEVLAVKYRIAGFALILVVIGTLANAILPRYYELKRLMISMLREYVPTPELDFQSDNGIDMSEQTNEDDYIASEMVESLDAPPITVDAPDEVEIEAETDVTNQSKGSFKRKCDEISEIYLLSDREKDVLLLLAKGHNASFITDKLCISRSTAKTHINHIYRKLDIHSQQELLNMVEKRKRP